MPCISDALHGCSGRLGQVPSFLVDKPEVADIDQPACALTEDADDVAPPDEVRKQHARSGQTHPPETDRHDRAFVALAEDPLQHHSAGEGDLPEQAENDPRDARCGSDIEEAEKETPAGRMGVDQFGEFTPQSKHQTIEDVAERAAGYNIPGIIVDGNDVLAVYEAASEAIALARKGGGPSLVECKTYRVRGHFEGDPMAYRDEEQAKEWMAKDPIMRFEEKLLEMGILASAQIEAMIPDIEKEMEDAVEFAEQSPFPDPSELMTDVYSD